MKNFIFFLFAFAFSITVFGQNEKYLKAMGAQLEKLQTAKTVEDFQAVANGFERIAQAERTEWLPAYYHSFSYMMMAATTMENGPANVDEYLDQAQAALDQTKKLAPSESEVYALQGYIYQGRIWPNPQQRGAEYTQKCYEALGAAMAMNLANPRPYFIKGQNTFFMPEFWGGGAKNALPLLSEAKEKFASFEPTSELHPNWGAKQNAYLWERCQAQLAVKE